MQIKEETHIILECRAHNYLFFQSVFGSEPSEKLLEAITKNENRLTFDVFNMEKDSPYAPALYNAFLAIDALKDCVNDSLDALQSDYTRLFFGPMKLEAPPWESIYRSHKDLLFTEDTLNVRNAYRAQGFLPAEYPKVADDHIAIECAFMAQLAGRMKDTYQTQDSETYKNALVASQQFLKEHLLVWIGSYVMALESSNSKANSFYPIVGKLAWEFMLIDQSILEDLTSELV
jgi:TorA maturation chaperone TorD